MGITATGGTITTVGAYTVHSFLTPSASFDNYFTVTDGSGTIDILCVGGGGGGGTDGTTGGSGGGAGSVETLLGYSVTAGAYPVRVGYGAAANNTGWSSIFRNQASANVLFGYGGGRGLGPSTSNGYDGGCGGGAPGSNSTFRTGGGVSVGSSGYAGGNNEVHTNRPAGGGGGAGAVGGTASGGVPGNGGAGKANNFRTGSDVYYGGGGGGGMGSGSTQATGGIGGGGDGGVNGTQPTSGQANTGGGGGGEYLSDGGSPSGGSGIIVIRYLTATTDTSKFFMVF